MKRVVLAGGSGHLGRLLTRCFVSKGIEVVILSRSNSNIDIEGVKYIQWDAKSLGDWADQLEEADTLINLTGESIQCRFTRRNKQRLMDSRLGPTALLGRAIQSLHSPPRLWINFSGISIFGGQIGLHSEESRIYGNDFLAILAQSWEDEFTKIALASTKKVILRISPVLTKNSGVFAELLPLVKLGLGGKVGKGTQMVSWIHEADLLQMIHWIIELKEPSSIYHACSPHPVRNEEFMKVFRKEAKVSFGLPLPAAIAKIGAFFKGVDSGLLLQTVSATTKATLEEGYCFKYNYLHAALAQLVKST